jgi:hypothetical protein
MSDPEQEFREELRGFIQALNAKGYGAHIKGYFTENPRFDEVCRDDIIGAAQKFTRAMEALSRVERR